MKVSDTKQKVGTLYSMSGQGIQKRGPSSQARALPNSNSIAEKKVPNGNSDQKLIMKFCKLFMNLLIKLAKKQTADIEPTKTNSSSFSSSASSTKSINSGPVGFLWKPVSDSDGNLAILLPSFMTSTVASVTVLDPNTRTPLAQGRYSGVGNGSREHYRFSEPGAKFPPNSIVQIKFKDGREALISIQDTGARVEGG